MDQKTIEITRDEAAYLCACLSSEVQHGLVSQELPDVKPALALKAWRKRRSTYVASALVIPWAKPGQALRNRRRLEKRAAMLARIGPLLAG